MLGRLLAAVSPANTPHGYNLTFAFPMLLFIVIAGALYLRFRSPHKVPGHAPMALSHPAGATGTVRPEAGTAAAGTGTAAGKGAAAGPGATGASVVGGGAAGSGAVGAGAAAAGAGETAAGQAGLAGTDGQDESQADGTETGE